MNRMTLYRKSSQTFRFFLLLAYNRKDWHTDAFVKKDHSIFFDEEYCSVYKVHLLPNILSDVSTSD